MNFLIDHQLDIMLFMCGMCGILTVMTLITKSLPYNTKIIIASMEVSAMLLLFFDRLAYIYRGDVSDTGFVMVRISNGLVYFLLLIIPFLLTRYLEDILIHEAGLSKAPKQLKAADACFGIGIVLVIISQFTGLYYTFDPQNNYQRAPLNALCYLMPFLIVILQEWTIIEYKDRVNRKIAGSMLVCIVLPTVASILQIFLYGLSLTNMTMGFVVCVFYTYTLRFLSEAAERAKEHELEYYKQAQAKEAELFNQTAEALANAIDAKDKYTSGHSTRVASYSRKIAKEAGLSDRECDEVYYAALLHDVGKIGVKSEIINKPGELTEDEFRQIQTHVELGSHILSSIRQAPYLSDGARYHHEHYDGHGYPDKLAGTQIPRNARIISVADSYDAMTSVRSYRDPLSIEKVIAELKNGEGTQFDPEYAEIMVRLINEGRL